MPIPYQIPDRWLRYDPLAMIEPLIDAKAAVKALTTMPYQRAWAERLQELELKREVAGTSRIEGADFTERELDIALEGDGVDTARLTRSQRQARAAQQTYKWIATLPLDRPIDEALIKEVHRRIVTGCDDDHCEPGALRSRDQNVTFGRPAHRGVEGGSDCREAFGALCRALGQEFRNHDPFIRALALHYHLGAMHPFQDGNGRTARAVEALVLQRARLKDDLFISMSNYYYDEKDKYLAVLAEVREQNADLTPFLVFGLRGIAMQCERLLDEIKTHVAKSLFRDVMARMYDRLLSTRTRGLAERQMAILDFLLEHEHEVDEDSLIDGIWPHFENLKAPDKAYARDMTWLEQINAITLSKRENAYYFSVRLEWSTEITETEFYKQLNRMPQAKSKFMRRRP